ncbi:MAG: L-aspartate oxidase, partial [Nodosilinea sp.]
HGANRLASNSLLECLVYGAELARLPLQPVPVDPAPTAEPPTVSSLDVLAQPWTEITDEVGAAVQEQRERLTLLMWDAAAISRDQAGLEAAIATLSQWRSDWQQHPLQALHNLPPGASYALPKGLSWPLVRAWGELCNLHDTAWLILNSAAFRTESRGGHFRQDYPHPSPEWQVHTVVEGDRWQKSSSV